MKKKVADSKTDKDHIFGHKQAAVKWIEKWEKEKIFEPDILSSPNPFYNLMMFPYPSAEGLHVGNMYAFSGADIYGRFMRMQGKGVFEPIGLDGFGIHSENYALKVGEHPADLAKKTEANFYRQLHEIGNAYDWSHKLETYDPDYYRYTQLIFIKLFKAGLAYRATAEVNWCPNCLTVLADEQVISRRSGDQVIGSPEGQKSDNPTTRQPDNLLYVCERCSTTVKKRDLTQWFFRITAYSERLLNNLNSLDWSEKVKIAQRNWIGKSEGASIMFQTDIDKDSMITVFTTRPDTIFGVTYIALAVDHPLVIKILSEGKRPLVQEIRTYLDNSDKTRNKKRETGNNQRDKDEKTGVFTGFYAVNSLSNKQVPIYIADYVLTGYGTGAVMGVPAHDQRDWEFATKYHIDIVEVIKQNNQTANKSIDNELIDNQSISQEAFTGTGKLINSDKFNNLESDDAIKEVIKYIKEHKIGDEAKMWHLRDWIISRQRYWGPPIPMVFCEKCAKDKKSWFTENGSSDKFQISNLKFKIPNSDWDSAGWYPVSEEELPVKLPYVEKFKPTGSGISPLASDENFVNVKCPQCGSSARRETDVSDTFLDSSWYFLRYPSVNEGNSKPQTLNSKQIINLQTQNTKKDLGFRNLNLGFPWDPEVTRRWLPVDMYIGGAEHSVLHLLYSRFVTMALFDLGLIDFEEPFKKFRAHGLLVKDGSKMSKSKGNVVNPDEYIEKFGVDTLRLYLMFCGRYDIGGDFRDTGIEGMAKFLRRVWGLVVGASGNQVTRKTKVQTEIGMSGEIPDNLTARLPENLYMMHKTIKKVTEDIGELSYNTAIAAMMEWVNFLEGKVSNVSKGSNVSKVKEDLFLKDQKANVSGEEIEVLLKLLAPFAPVMTEELWDRIKVSNVSRVSKVSKVQGGGWSIHLQEWPKFDANLAISAEIEIIVQVNGKMREKIKTERGVAREKIEDIAIKLPQVAKYLESKEYKTIFVPDRIINFVIE